MESRRSRLAAAAICALLVTFSGTGLAIAEQSSGEDDEELERWSITLAAFSTDFETKARWDDETLGPGTTINLEDDLALEEDLTKGRVEGFVRLGKRSSLNVGYLRLRRSAARKLLEEEIQWSDKIYEIGALVETDFDTDLYKLSWIRNVVRKPRFSFGVSAGVSVVDLSGSIRGILTAGGGAGTDEFREEEEEELLAPVPVIGIYLKGELHRDLFLRSYGQFFTYSDGEWDAEFLDYLVAAEYVPFDHVGFGLGYDWFSIEYQQDRDDLQADYEFHGWMYYVRVFF